MSIKQTSDNLSTLIENTIFLGSLPSRLHTNVRDICNVATEIYVAKFQNNYTWLQTTIHADVSLRNRHLISPQVSDWYAHIVKTKLWDYSQFYACQMWVI